jgi:transcriptional regulator with XRE-family HTH domain
MNALQLGARIRAVRLRRGLRQRDVAEMAGVSQSTVSRIERGHIATIRFGDVERVAAVLEIRVDLLARWRGGDLDRLVNAGHGEMHEAGATWFAQRWPAWVLAHEVSFSIFGERGFVDMLAWHPRRRALLVVELKTAIVDVSELAGTLDRKRRLAAEIVKERGWRPLVVGAWLAIAATRTNERRVNAHGAMLRNTLPANGHQLRRWLTTPNEPISAMSLESFGRPEAVLARRRVRQKSAPREPVAA